MGLGCSRGWGDRRLDSRFVGCLGARRDQSASFGEVTPLGIGDNGAEAPQTLASVAAFG
jgi:hypothetical protein